jgi:hypothetical protein
LLVALLYMLSFLDRSSTYLCILHHCRELPWLTCPARHWKCENCWPRNGSTT